jgi:hypothetical protein
MDERSTSISTTLTDRPEAAPMPLMRQEPGWLFHGRGPGLDGLRGISILLELLARSWSRTEPGRPWQCIWRQRPCCVCSYGALPGRTWTWWIAGPPRGWIGSRLDVCSRSWPSTQSFVAGLSGPAGKRFAWVLSRSPCSSSLWSCASLSRPMPTRCGSSPCLAAVDTRTASRRGTRGRQRRSAPGRFPGLRS